jgi:hypothetical protein
MIKKKAAFALDRKCPRCLAPAGQPCRGRHGQKIVVMHPARTSRTGIVKAQPMIHTAHKI